MRRRGFGDILIPLQKGVGHGSLKHVAELKLVFESDRVETIDGTPGKGQLAIHSIRLIPPKKAETRPARDLLDDLAARAFSWFETYRNPTSGLVPDRAPNWRCVGWPDDARTIPCSIASVGYYLSMLPDAVKTQRLSEAQARERAVSAMRFLETNAEQHAGFLHHFLDMKTGKPAAGSEVSVLDSAILFNGCMVASVYFGGEVKDISDRLLARARLARIPRSQRGGQAGIAGHGVAAASEAYTVRWTCGHPSSPWRVSWQSGHRLREWIRRSGGTWP